MATTRDNSSLPGLGYWVGIDAWADAWADAGVVALTQRTPKGLSGEEEDELAFANVNFGAPIKHSRIYLGLNLPERSEQQTQVQGLAQAPQLGGGGGSAEVEWNQVSVRPAIVCYP